MLRRDEPRGVLMLPGTLGFDRSGKPPMIVHLLRSAVRAASDGEHTRNMPLENYYEQCLSWAQARGEVFFVRIAPVDDKGRPFGNLSTLPLLAQCVVSALSAKHTIYSGMIADHVERYSHYYNLGAFDYIDGLYVPNSEFCTTWVALRRTVKNA